MNVARRIDRRVAFGREGEALVERHLTRLGYQLLARRFRVRNGEIDLVMVDRGSVVFVEVRRRRGAAGPDPLESISQIKRSRIVRAARLFLAIRNLHDRPCRFDVVAVREGAAGPVLEHVVDAFRADGWAP